MNDNLRIIISGGGTGGHIFPALSIANAIKEARPDAEILFVGAEGRMEMQRVPAAGYKIIGLPVAGFDRKNLLKNFAVVVRLIRSQMIARKIIKDFNPHAAVGVGGYASGPTLKMAGAMGIPTLIQEQNSYAGVTNKLLAAKAEKICVAYPGMERFFDKNKIIMTGNPVRQGLLDNKLSKEEVEVYQFRAKKAMDCEGSLRRTAAIHSPSVRPSRTKSSPVKSASGTSTKSRPVILGCGMRSSGSSLTRSS